ncbi:hypothetical protein [Paenibacillus mesotrionivorans]|uniref:Uncharacterized protein n=1 Tax=Paenibacillus mesotrionivorans TaxID=3160968 RepID=A0ACC7NZA7_9BACL
MQWIWNHMLSILLFGALGCTLLASALVLISIDGGRRQLVMAEMKQAIKWGIVTPIQFGQKIYASEATDELLESMGWRKYISGPTIKMIRDGITLLLMAYVLMQFHGPELVRPIVYVVFVFLTLTPGPPGPFYAFIRPLFQRIQRHRANREVALLIQLLRNETQSEVQQSVIALIRQFRPYTKALENDLYMLEHDWRKGKEEALARWQRRHPKNEDIAYLISLLRSIDEIGYTDCAKSLAANEKTLHDRQAANYTSKMQDLNRFLFIFNITGVVLACLWFVMAVFQWAYGMDTGL